MILIPVVIMSCSVTRAGDKQLLYLASQQQKAIVAYDISNDSGELTRRFQFDMEGTPGAMTYSPDESMIYVLLSGLENGGAAAATVARDQHGSLTLKGTAAVMGGSPYICCSQDGRCLLAAHYGAGEVTVYRITNGVCTEQLLDHRMTARTAHCIELDPSGQFVFVPHTRPNRVDQFRLDSNSGVLTPNTPPHVKGPDENHLYHEPRHYAHHPRLNMAYTANENGGGISAWKFDPKTGTLKLVQTLSSLPPGFDGQSAGADIHITPDGRFAYVSNRDVTQRGEGDPQQDTMAGFALDETTGRMKLIGHIATVELPRSFCIDRTGNFLFAGGQQTRELFAYRIDQTTGELSLLKKHESDGRTIWVMCGSVQAD
ncbi:MAG: lactonase family protein [Fuerstiella sp.]|nr:lactonase family protein [Fuerstiella sp.]